MNTLFQQYLNKAQEIQKQTIADSTQKTYSTYLSLYEKILQEKFEIPPYPIDIDKMMAYLGYQKDQGLEYNSLKCCISALSNYFSSNQLPNLTLDVRFSNFHKGLLRDMKAHRDPNRKEPWDPKFFDQYLQIYPLNELSNTRFLFYMSLSYYDFLRISELLNLKFVDVTQNNENKNLQLYIRFSKTDQVGNGATTYIYDNEKSYSPYKLFDILKDTLSNSDDIVLESPTYLRHHLKTVLQMIGVNPMQYSWHSFRRGGAHQAAILGIQDSQIKKHGRWKSEAYIRYVYVDPSFAGLKISEKI